MFILLYVILLKRVIISFQSQDDDLEEKPVEKPAALISSGTVSNMSNKILSPTDEGPSPQPSPQPTSMAGGIAALKDKINKSGGVPTIPPAQQASSQRTPQIKKREADRSWENYER